MSDFGVRLNQLRTKKGISLKDLALQTGTSRSYLWKLENGSASNPSLQLMCELSEALGITLGVFAREHQPNVVIGIPNSLQECQEKYNIPVSDVDDLARIRFRGGHPVRSDDWYLIYGLLKKLVK